MFIKDRFFRKAPALFLSAALCLPTSCIAATAWQVSPYGSWVFAENPAFAQGRSSPSRLLRLNEALPHHKLTLRQRKGIIADYSLSFACMLQGEVPVLELRVPALDISMEDTIRGYAFARFMVDEGQEFSLRGEIVPPGRLIFAPLTRSQEGRLSSLWLQLAEGGTLKAALLQGKSVSPRTYDFPLAGFAQFAEELAADCSRLNQAAGGRAELLPDYLTQEPENSAPEDYSLKEKPAAGQPLQAVESAPPTSPPTSPDTPPPALIFRPDGGPATIGADGRPVGAGESADFAVVPDAQAAGQNQPGTADTEDTADSVDKGEISFGQAAGPMAIGSDGQPVPPANP